MPKNGVVFELEIEKLISENKEAWEVPPHVSNTYEAAKLILARIDIEIKANEANIEALTKENEKLRDFKIYVNRVTTG